MELNEENLKAITEAPDKLRKNWTKTQRFIAKVVEEVREELGKGIFDGDVENGVD